MRERKRDREKKRKRKRKKIASSGEISSQMKNREGN